MASKHSPATFKASATQVIDLLNAAMAEEWHAYYLHWGAARLVSGPARVDMREMLLHHGAVELAHAGCLCRRIMELGGTPLPAPRELPRPCVSNSLAGVEKLVKAIRVTAESAMIRYHEIAEAAGADTVTTAMAVEMLADEAVREQEMQNLLDDLKGMRKLAV